MPIREETYRFKAEIDQQSLQQQLAQIRMATAASMQMQSPHMSQQAMGHANTMYLGFNSVMSDLSRSSNILPPAQYNPNSTLMNLSLGQSMMGTMGFGAPNTMRVQQWEDLTKEDMRHRASAGVSAALVGGAETVLKYAPAAMAGYAAMGMAGSGALGAVGIGAPSAANFAFGAGITALTGGGLGAAAMGGLSVGAGMGVLGITGALGYGASKIGEQVSTQGRIENMLFAASAGRMSSVDRAQIGRGVRGVLNKDSMLDVEEGMDLLAYGTQEGLLSANQDSEKYTRNYKALLKSAKTIMKTFHQSVKDAVKTMGELREAGVLDMAEIGQEGLITESRAAIAGMTPSQMLQTRQTGARIGFGTNVGGEAAGRMSMTFAAMINQLKSRGVTTERELSELTGGKVGQEAAAAAGLALTSDITRFFESRTGRGAVVSLLGMDGEINEEKLVALLGGKLETGELARGSEKLLNKYRPKQIASMAGQAIGRMQVHEKTSLIDALITYKIKADDPEANVHDRAIRLGTLRGQGFSNLGANVISDIRSNEDLYIKQAISDINTRQKEVSDVKHRESSMESAWNIGLSVMWGHGGDVMTYMGEAAGEGLNYVVDSMRNRRDTSMVGGYIGPGEDIEIYKPKVGERYTDRLFSRTWKKSWENEVLGMGGLQQGRRSEEFMNLMNKKADDISRLLSDPSRYMNDADWAGGMLRRIGRPDAPGVESFRALLPSAHDPDQLEKLTQLRMDINKARAGQTLGVLSGVAGDINKNWQKLAPEIDRASLEHMRILSIAKHIDEGTISEITSGLSKEELAGSRSLRELKTSLNLLLDKGLASEVAGPSARARNANNDRMNEIAALNLVGIRLALQDLVSSKKIEVKVTK